MFYSLETSLTLATFQTSNAPCSSFPPVEDYSDTIQRVRNRKLICPIKNPETQPPTAPLPKEDPVPALRVLRSHRGCLLQSFPPFYILVAHACVPPYALEGVRIRRIAGAR